jgi:hypothetical protein
MRIPNPHVVVDSVSPEFPACSKYPGNNLGGRNLFSADRRWSRHWLWLRCSDIVKSTLYKHPSTLTHSVVESLQKLQRLLRRIDENPLYIDESATNHSYRPFTGILKRAFIKSTLNKLVIVQFDRCLPVLIFDVLTHCHRLPRQGSKRF